MNDHDRMRVALLLGTLMAPALALPGSSETAWPRQEEPKFVVYYGKQDQVMLDDFDLAVLDSNIDPHVPLRLGRHGRTLGYLSLGEVHLGRPWAAEMERQGLLLDNNPKWRDARFVDLRDERWKARVLDQLIPDILSRGFTGLFLDTLDDAGYLESVDLPRFSGMKDAAVDLVSAMRSRFPKIPIMVNRAYDILPRIVSKVDMVLGESVHATYDVTTSSYASVPITDIRWQIYRLHEARRLKPGLGLYCLNYWMPNDPVGIARIYAEAREDGLVPYVATFDLTQVVPRS
jgi:polysaccharide biosynthesis protein PelA